MLIELLSTDITLNWTCFETLFTLVSLVEVMHQNKRVVFWVNTDYADHADETLMLV